MNVIMIIWALNLICFFVNVRTPLCKVGKYVIGPLLRNKINIRNLLMSLFYFIMLGTDVSLFHLFPFTDLTNTNKTITACTVIA